MGRPSVVEAVVVWARLPAYVAAGAVATVVLGLPAALGCSGPDPGEVKFAERTGQGGAPRPAPTAAPTDTPASSDAGAPDPVFGTSAFQAGQPPANAPAKGKNASHPGPDQNPAGADCAGGGCHVAGGPAPVWGFGGTIYVAANGGAPVAGAEVRVTGANGEEYARTFSDADGNFWVSPKPPTDIPAGSRVGVRAAGKAPKLMQTTVAGPTGAACNAPACHANPMMRVYLD